MWHTSFSPKFEELIKTKKQVSEAGVNLPFIFLRNGNFLGSIKLFKPFSQRKRNLGPF